MMITRKEEEDDDNDWRDHHVEDNDYGGGSSSSVVETDDSSTGSIGGWDADDEDEAASSGMRQYAPTYITKPSSSAGRRRSLFKHAARAAGIRPSPDEPTILRSNGAVYSSSQEGVQHPLSVPYNKESLSDVTESGFKIQAIPSNMPQNNPILGEVATKQGDLNTSFPAPRHIGPQFTGTQLEDSQRSSQYAASSPFESYLQIIQVSACKLFSLVLPSYPT